MFDGRCVDVFGSCWVLLVVGPASGFFLARGGVFGWCWRDERNKLHSIYGSVYSEAELDLESRMCIVGK